MTNHWIDIKNSDRIIIMGSNAAENHPISFKYVTQAMEGGAKLISVDPRFTRTSAKADYFAQIRPGTDIAFVNGMINYCIENNMYNEEYVRIHTNALCKVSEDFEFSDGLFSSYDTTTGKYTKESWQYQLDAENNNVKGDSLEDPDCVFALLKEHVSGYTAAKVEEVTGISQAKFKEIAEAYCYSGQTDKVGTIMYAMGWTQHTTGVQNIRAMAIAPPTTAFCTTFFPAISRALQTASPTWIPTFPKRPPRRSTRARAPTGGSTTRSTWSAC